MPLRSKRRRSTRKGKTVNSRNPPLSVVDENVESAMITSSDQIDLDSEDEEVLKIAEANLRRIQKDLSRNCRLTKLKLGTEWMSQTFNKATFAKCMFMHEEEEDKSINASSIQNKSFNNVASSSGNQIKNEDKSSSNESRSAFLNTQKTIEISQANSMKEVAFQESKLNCNHSDSQLKQLFVEDQSKESSSYLFEGPTQSKIGKGRAVVVPGPNVNQPLSVLRRPVAGELAVSIFGSPLLVASDCTATTMPQITFPTADGKVVSILPHEGFTVDDMPHLTTPTRFQLKTLNQYLKDLCTKHDPTN